MHHKILSSLAILVVSAVFCLAQDPNVVVKPSVSSQLIKQIIDLPAPAPNLRPLNERMRGAERPAEFYAFKNVPADDAPIDEILDYWRSDFGDPNQTATLERQPSMKVAERIIEYCTTHPEKLNDYLRIMPVTPEISSAVKAVYDQNNGQDTSQPFMMGQVKAWLTHNSNYFMDDLLREVSKVKDENNYVSNANQYALRSLAKVDWDSARPIVERLETNPSEPYSQILAKWVRYQHAMSSGDQSDIDRYRRELQQIVENREAPWAQRDLAMDSLVSSGDWSGRDEWYLSLFDDPTLLTIQDNGYTGLTTLMSASPPDKFTDQMLKLLRSNSATARSGAARNLIADFNGDPKILSELLPWLTDPAWAKESRNNERSELINVLAKLSVPESIPGLISIVMNEPEKRRIAALALEKYKDPRANPAFRFALSQEENPDGRDPLISGLIACGGLSDDEQLSALEAYVTLISTKEGQDEFAKYSERYSEEYGEGDDVEDPSPSAPARAATTKGKEEPGLPLQISIGVAVAQQTEPNEGLVVLAIDRLKTLRRTNPAAADLLADTMLKWKGRAIYLESLRKIRNGEAGLADILRLLAERRDVREKVPNEVMSLRGANGIVGGVGACLAEDQLEYTDVLSKDDDEAISTMLGCARQLRASLPLQTVGALLSNKNNLLSLAAERYLEMNDSVEARKMVLARHPGEARVLGARLAFVPDGVKNFTETAELNALHQSVTGLPVGGKDFSSLEKFESGLRNEIQKDPSLMAVFGILNDNKAGHRIIRVYSNKIELTYYEDEARYWTRNLEKKDYDDLMALIASGEADKLSGLSSICYGCPSSEFAMFTRDGGRRVYFPNYAKPDVAGMDKMLKIRAFFEELRKGKSELHYRFAENIKGLEVLWANPKQPVRAVWKKGPDLRFLIEDEDVRASIWNDLEKKDREEMSGIAADDEITPAQRQGLYQRQQKRRIAAAQAHYSWQRLDGQSISQPPEAAFLYDPTQLGQAETIDQSPRPWQVRSGSDEIRTSGTYSEDAGLFRVDPSGHAVKMREGFYSSPIVSGDGRWAVVTKLEAHDGEEQTSIVRIDLASRRELKVAVPSGEDVHAIAFVSALNKILVYRGPARYRRFEGEDVVISDENPARANSTAKPSEYYLVDPLTGTAQIVKGEFKPFEQQTYRPLQATAAVGEYWAAVYDEKTNSTRIGRYDPRSFTLKPVLTLPSIVLNSMDIWVDEPEGKLYFVYSGHLLRLPIAQQTGSSVP